MRTGRARRLRPLAMAIVAERALHLGAIQRFGLGTEVAAALPVAETPTRRLIRGSSLWLPRVARPAVRQYVREATWRPWWLS